MTVEVLGRTADEWAEVVRADLSRSVEGFVSAGQHLIEAKGELSHGEWLPFLEEKVGISRDTAHRLMAIAQHGVLSNVAHAPHLPSSRETLYILSRLTKRQLERAIKKGLVTPDMERKEAQALVKQLTAPPKPKAPKVPAKATSQSGEVEVLIGEIVGESTDVEVEHGLDPDEYVASKPVISTEDMKELRSRFIRATEALHDISLRISAEEAAEVWESGLIHPSTFLSTAQTFLNDFADKRKKDG